MGAGGIMFEQSFKNIGPVLWKKAGCTTDMSYTEQTSWKLHRRAFAYKRNCAVEAKRL